VVVVMERGLEEDGVDSLHETRDECQLAICGTQGYTQVYSGRNS
jgi:hypothetical protein